MICVHVISIFLVHGLVDTENPGEECSLRTGFCSREKLLEGSADQRRRFVDLDASATARAAEVCVVARDE